MRGKPFLQCKVFLQYRITPAYAGKTVGLLEDLAGAEDHPRVCGENHTGYNLLAKRAGSPPRMRGKHDAENIPQRFPGITPAYAGKTAQGYAAEICHGDHPRVCGENNTASALSDRRIGSPPRMRGKPGASKGYERSDGITPAYAGKTRTSATRAAMLRDHPRVCGEN